MTLRAALVALAAAATLAACAGWEGPGNWLDQAFIAGRPTSACVAATGQAPGDYPAEQQFNASFAGWSGGVRAQRVACTTHTDPLNISKAAWVQCRVEGPALITHSPALAGVGAFVAGAGMFDLRATRHGLSCRPIKR